MQGVKKSFSLELLWCWDEKSMAAIVPSTAIEKQVN